MEEKFEAWALIELFGHNRMAGKVSEQTVGGSSFIRVDVPETTEGKSFTRFLHANAIYAINPVTEEVAKGMAEAIKAKPIELWDMRDVLKRVEDKKLAEVSESFSKEEFDADDQ